MKVNPTIGFSVSGYSVMSYGFAWVFGVKYALPSREFWGVREEGRRDAARADWKMTILFPVDF